MRRKNLWIASVLIFLTVFGIYLQGNAGTLQDSRWSIPTAMSIVREGNTNLDEYQNLIAGADYRIQRVGGHLYNFYPVGVSVFAAPFVFALDRMSTFFVSFDLVEYLEQAVPSNIERFVASFAVALTAVFVFLIVSHFLDAVCSLLLTFVFAFCTSAWSTASRSLWQHGPSMLMLTIALYLILLARDNGRLIQYVSLPLAFAYVVRPTNGISIVLLTAFVFLQYRRFLLRYLLWAMPIAGPFLLFNYSVYRAPLSPYYLQRLGNNPHFFEALAGNLASPSRGLFVFTPILLFSLIGYSWKIRGDQSDRLHSFIMAIIVLHWISISSFPIWWAGHSFGPRFFSDMLPYLVYLLVPVLIRLPQLGGWRKTIGVVTFAGCMAVSFCIHYLGVTNPSVLTWNAEPTNIDVEPERVWDWHDVQFLRPAPRTGAVASPPQPPRITRSSMPNKTDVIFGRAFALRGYQLDADEDQVTIVLYWQAVRQPDFDYSVFVHILDDSNSKVAQKDQSPGASVGNPPTLWQIGDMVEDRHVIELPSEMAQGSYHITVGVYNWDTGERLQVRDKDESAGDIVVLSWALRR